MKIYKFKQCEVQVHLDRDYTVTLFHDGTRVPAAPHAEGEQFQTARRLGYGADVAAMCREHELLHTWLCERFHLPYSPTLWAVAHGQGEGCIPVKAQHEEEALVLAFQAYLNGRPAGPALDSLIQRGLSLEALRNEAQTLFRDSAESLVEACTA